MIVRNSVLPGGGRAAGWVRVMEAVRAGRLYELPYELPPGLTPMQWKRNEIYGYWPDDAPEDPPRPASCPVVASPHDGPLRAVKYAKLLWDSVAPFHGTGFAVMPPYAREATATCQAAAAGYFKSWAEADPLGLAPHDAPHPDCTCGFYGLPSLRAADFSYWGANCGYWRLDVELHGLVIEHTGGWRAQYQRVLAIAPPPPVPGRCCPHMTEGIGYQLIEDRGRVYCRRACDHQPWVFPGQHLGFVTLAEIRAMVAPVEVIPPRPCPPQCPQWYPW
jgi:hypothetical protein